MAINKGSGYGKASEKRIVKATISLHGENSSSAFMGAWGLLWSELQSYPNVVRPARYLLIFAHLSWDLIAWGYNLLLAKESLNC